MLLINLEKDEMIVAEAQAAHITMVLMVPKPQPGILYITNRKIAFAPTQGSMYSKFEYLLGEIEAFSLGMLNTLTLMTKAGKKHKITGMFNKKLIEGLKKVGVKEI